MSTELPGDRMRRIFAGQTGKFPSLLPENGQESGPNKELSRDLVPEPLVEIITGSMKKLNPSKVEGLDLPKVESPLITSAIRTKTDGTKEIIHVLRTSEGSLFELEPENPLLQELQITAASAAIDAFEAQTPIQTASAIKKAIQEYAGKGIVYRGSPFQAWDFAIKALEKMRDFQKIQLEVIQLNTMQAATRQLQTDQSLPLHKWMMLPPHRKEAAMLITEIGLVATMQNFIGPEAVQAASNMKDISLSLGVRRKELAEMWVNSYKDMALGVVSGTGETAINLIGKVISQAGNSGSEVAQVVLKVVFGEDLADEGAVKALLERSGETGQKLLDMISKSGLTINQFFRNLFKDAFKKEDQEQKEAKSKK